MLDFRRLLYFCTIVEQGQISRAANFLHITQPSLSLSLKELEDELGITLIYREKGKWQVTEQGQSFYIEAQRILTQLDDLQQNVQNPLIGSSGIFGEVRLGCSGFCLSFLKAILPAIEKDFPGIHIRLLVTDNILLENKIQSHSLDLAILHLPLMNSNYTSVPLTEQHLVSVWSPLLTTPKENPVSLETLAKFPLLLSRRWTNRGSLRPFMIAMQEKNLKPHVILDTTTPYWIMDTLQELPAVAILHHTECSKNMPYARLPIDLPKLTFQPVIIWKKDNYISPACNKVIELLSNISKITQE